MAKTIHSTIYLYGKTECFEFETIDAAADWLVNNGYVTKHTAAYVGILAVLQGKGKSYKGFEISEASQL